MPFLLLLHGVTSNWCYALPAPPSKCDQQLVLCPPCSSFKVLPAIGVMPFLLLLFGVTSNWCYAVPAAPSCRPQQLMSCPSCSSFRLSPASGVMPFLLLLQNVTSNWYHEYLVCSICSCPICRPLFAVAAFSKCCCHTYCHTIPTLPSPSELMRVVFYMKCLSAYMLTHRHAKLERC